MAAHPPICDFGWKAPDFALPGLDGQPVTLSDVRGANGTLVMFICNHCPYVRSITDRIVREAAALDELGIGVVAIMSNDWQSYPDDSPQNMIRFADENKFTFPYLLDQDQSIARAYDAVCTPDFFGFDAGLGLQYRGRLDASGRQAAAPDTRRELYEAMRQIAETGHGPEVQTSAMGCAIKWR
ncbi:MAG: thioredoxin family protein [Robiginitomaculum sp.]|nr:MAG: thioredoxin family protein [Robiginitomaculum sp.]